MTKFRFPVDAALVGIALSCANETHFLAHGSVMGHLPYYADEDWDAVRADMRKLYALVHGGIPSIIAAADMTQTALAKRFCIPLRTVQHWCAGTRSPSDYTIGMICEILFN